MKTSDPLKHEFVEYIPSDLKEGTIYVSIPFATVVHKCCCGCGNEVVTPLSPTDWKLVFDGVSISLDPSIGNWSFACKSHYFIRHNKIVWASQWSQEQIDAGRAYDRHQKDRHYGLSPTAETQESREMVESKEKRSFWQKLIRWLSR